MNIKLFFVGLVLLTTLLFFGCVEETDNNNDELIIGLQNAENRLNEKNDSINELNTKVIELQENNEYLRKQAVLVKEEQGVLQEYYNKLFDDAVICYWANDCLYYPDACVDHFKDGYVGWTAREIHVLESDRCETMIRDWDKYVELNTGLVD